MKHYILVSVTIPERSKTARWQAWQGFLQALAEQADKSPENGKLAENVWLLPRENGVSFFATLVHQAEHFGLQPQVRFLREDD
jgi:hypothetical protein